MSTKRSTADFPQAFDINDIVTFPSPDGSDELRGRVVLVCGWGDLYVVIAEGERYQVGASEMKLASQD